MLEKITPLISILSPLIGAFIGVLTGQKVTLHRLDQLEKKMDKHNNLIERMAVVEHEQEVAAHRIKKLEEQK